MKAKITLILLLLIGFNMATAQDEDCRANLSLFVEDVKIKNYDKAYEPWMAVRKQCPKFNKAIYVYGEKILKHKIKNSTGGEKTGYVNDLLKLHDESLSYMPNKFKKGSILAKKAQVMYDNKLGSKSEVYAAFDKAYTTDKATFTNPKSLYYYFETLFDMYKGNEGGATLENVFDKYEDLKAKFTDEQNKLARKLDVVLTKEENGVALTKKDTKTKKLAETNTKAIVIFANNMDVKVSEVATCDRMIPIYKKNFESKKSDSAWLQRIAGSMLSKECTDDPLFVQVVEALHALEPSADSAYYLGVLCQRNKDFSCAEKYFNEAISLHTDKYKKADVYMRIAYMNKARGRKGAARANAMSALKERPSLGRAYMLISRLYASSANACGDTKFNKLAVYWLAANMADKAGQVDPSSRANAAKSAKSYRAKAPSKTDIFSEGAAGKTIQIGCWINRSVKVPNI